jgi:hypothetical protein
VEIAGDISTVRGFKSHPVYHQIYAKLMDFSDIYNIKGFTATRAKTDLWPVLTTIKVFWGHALPGFGGLEFDSKPKAL